MRFSTGFPLSPRQDSSPVPARPDPSELARFVRQRRELGAEDWIFENLTETHVLDAVSHVSSRPGSYAKSRETASIESEPAGSVALPTAATPAQASGEYLELRGRALECTRCRLATERSQVVFSDGNPDARVMVVGEAPGANEDRTGLPFVGAAGKLLDLLLAAIGLSREESVYICNVIKCRPPGNRNPQPDEIAACAPFLRQQIALVRPEVILAVGAFAGQLLSNDDRPLGKLRGEVYAYEEIPLVVTYHPAALLRNSGWTRATWDDLQLLRKILDD